MNITNKKCRFFKLRMPIFHISLKSDATTKCVYVFMQNRNGKRIWKTESQLLIVRWVIQDRICQDDAEAEYYVDFLAYG